MKKTALLFTILCVGQLYGMENPHPELGAFGQLPEELHKEIVKTLATSNNLEATIGAIKVAGTLQGVRYDNLKDFTRLVNVLADTFGVSTVEVAKKFNTPTAKQYLNFEKAHELIKLANRNRRENLSESYQGLVKLIREGFNVNTTGWSNGSLLMWASFFNLPVLVKVLLDAGANPHHRNDDGETALDMAVEYGNDAETIQLLKQAMTKQQQQQQK